MTAPRVVPPEGPAENLRNALALLGALRALFTVERQSPVGREVVTLVEAVSQRIWAALQQVEGTK